VGALCIQLCSISPRNTSGKVGVRGPGVDGGHVVSVMRECEQGLVNLFFFWTWCCWVLFCSCRNGEGLSPYDFETVPFAFFFV
jgi:hypothetical protein